MESVLRDLPFLFMYLDKILVASTFIAEVTPDTPLVNSYLHFIPSAAQLMRALYEALKSEAPNHLVDWSMERDEAFVDTKMSLLKQ